MKYKYSEIDRINIAFWIVASMCMYVCATKYNVGLDDAFIYLRISDNWWLHGRPVFNIGDGFSPATGPAWSILLAALRGFTSSELFPLACKWLWVILLVIAARFAYLVFRKDIGPWSALIPMPFLLPDFVYWCMGNEIALLAVASFGLLWSTRAGYAWLSGFFIGLGYLCRGEFIFSAFPVALYALYSMSGKFRRQPSDAMRWLVKVAVTSFVMAMTWHIYTWAIFGNFFPSTLQAKIVQGQANIMPSFWAYLPNMVRLFFNDKLWLIGVVIIGTAWQFRVALPSLLFVIIHLTVYSYLGVPQYHWYYWSLYLFVQLFIYIGSFWISSAFVKSLLRFHVSPFIKNIIPWIGYSLPVALAIWLNWPGSKILEPIRLVQNRLEYERAETYEKLSVIIRPILQAGDILLTPEIGIIGWQLREFEIRDINGLATPNVQPHEVNQWAPFVERLKPDYLIYVWGNSDDTLTFSTATGSLVYNKLFTVSPLNLTYKCAVFVKADTIDNTGLH
jgi:hypothetical protein